MDEATGQALTVLEHEDPEETDMADAGATEAAHAANGSGAPKLRLHPVGPWSRGYEP